MRISTSTCSHEKTLWKKEMQYSGEDSIRAIAEAGFRVIDMNFESYCRCDNALTGDDWENWCYRQKKAADEMGITIEQAHAHFFLLEPDGTELERDRELIRRSIVGAGIMGVKWMVFHPYSLSDCGWFSYEKSFARNVELFTEYAAMCKPNGVNVAIENLFATDKHKSSRFSSDPHDIIRLVDTMNAQSTGIEFGICWDFGHAHLNGLDQSAALRLVGSRLKALHVDDNHGVTDEHLCPYFGTIVWEPIMKTLKDIGYDGDFTYEIFRFHYGLPDALQSATLDYSYRVAEYLVSLAR